MNPFRVILLVILSLSLAMMFYVVAFYLPQQKEDYKLYQSMRQITHLQNKHKEHIDRMNKLAPAPAQTEESMLNLAQKEAQLAAAEQQRLLVEAEEKLVINEARVRELQQQEEQKRQQRADAQAASQQASVAAIDASNLQNAQLTPIGGVHSYDAEWCILAITPASHIDPAAMKDQRVMIKRGEGLICEAIIESYDTNAKLIVANVEAHTLNPVAKVIPEAGDQIFVSTLKNVSQLRNEGVGAVVQPALPVPPAINPMPQAGQEDLNEVELPLVPSTL